MDPLTLALIMGSTGLVKSQLIDKPKEDRQRKLASETQRYAPWTGLKAGEIQEADPFGSSLNYGMTGASLGQNMQNQEANNKLQAAQLKWFNQNGGGAGQDGLTQDQLNGMGGMNYGNSPRNPWSL